VVNEWRQLREQAQRRPLTAAQRKEVMSMILDFLGGGD
jgi:hypothetical protein